MISLEQLHPPLTAFPFVILCIVVILEIICWQRGDSRIRFVVPGLLGGLVIVSIAAYLSGGEAAEHTSQTFSVPEDALSAHYRMARLFLISTFPAAILGILLGRVVFGKAGFRVLYALALLLSLSLCGWTGYLGGELVFRHGAGVEAPRQ